MLILSDAAPIASSAQHDAEPSEMCKAGLGAGPGFNGANAPVSVFNKYPIGQVSTHVVLPGHEAICPMATYPVGQISATGKVCSTAAIKPVGHSAALAVWLMNNISANEKLLYDILNNVLHNWVAKIGGAGAI